MMTITIRMKLTLKQQPNHSNLKNQVKASHRENQEMLDDNSESFYLILVIFYLIILVVEFHKYFFRFNYFLILLLNY